VRRARDSTCSRRTRAVQPSASGVEVLDRRLLGVLVPVLFEQVVRFVHGRVRGQRLGDEAEQRGFPTRWLPENAIRTARF